MGPLEKISEAVAVVGQKKESLQNVMGLIMHEWEGVEDKSREIRDLLTQIVGEIESKHKHPMEVVESVKLSYELLNSKKRWLEEGLNKLDERVKFVRGVLKEVKEWQAQSRIMRDSMDQQLKELALKEQQIQHLPETLKVTLRHVEERKNELDLMERDLNGRKDEIDRWHKKLEAWEFEALAKKQMLERRQHEMDSEKKRLESELESRKASLVERERVIASKERTLMERESENALKLKRLESELESRKASLVERESVIAYKERTVVGRESEIALKQKKLESEFESRKASLIKRESMIVSKERTLVERESEIALKQKKLGAKELDVECKEQREVLMRSKAMRDPREKFIQQPDSYTITKSAQGIRMEGNRRDFVDGSAGEVLAMASPRPEWKRRRFGDGITEHIKAHLHPQKSGSNYKLRAKTTEEIVVLDDCESDSDVRDDLVLKDTCAPNKVSGVSTQKRELVQHFSVGETWACCDGKDRMPRSYVRILHVFEQGGIIHLQIEWMKPQIPRYEGEKEWISAGLPVACGTFEPFRTSVELTHILFQPMFSAKDHCTIFPFIGETWAIYKDWDIKTWSAHPEIHRSCEYEIVEILPYPHGGLPLGVRVAYLDRVRGSICSFQRRSKKEDSFLIPASSLYRFSHKVLHVKSTGNHPNVPEGVFELDQNALPPGALPPRKKWGLEGCSSRNG